MVFKSLAGGESGNLANPVDFYGYFSDTVLVTDNETYVIRTYESNDRIDASRVTANGLHAIYAGSGNDTVLCNSATDEVLDGSGNDRVSLGAGDDTWYVGSGNDVVDGGSGTNDFLNFMFQSNDGLDAFAPNSIGLTIDLAKTTAQNLGVFGFDTIRNFENVDCGSGADRIAGNAAANRLNGNGGNDVLSGRVGNDEIFAGDGSDTLIGGFGADQLRVLDGIALRDTIRYFAMTDSGIADPNRDEIFDFDAGGTTTDDKIDLSAIDANTAAAGNQAFTFRGAGAFVSAAGEIRLETVGTDTLVHVDIDADAGSEMTIWVRSVTGLVAADFIL